MARLCLALILLVLPFLPAAQPLASISQSENITNSTAKAKSLNAPQTQVVGVSVLTQHNDINRTGANLNETILNLNNVNQYQFGKIFTRTVDAGIYAQPLFVPNVNITTTRNVVYIATQNNSVYAFDADDPNAVNPLWQVSLGTAPPATDFGQSCGGNYRDISGNVGIISTPVIDPNNNTMYVVNLTKIGSSYFHLLHSLDITTGLEKASSPITITAVISSTSLGSSGGSLAFDSSKHLQRTGLLLANGNIYFAFAGYCDTPPYHGWVFSYNATSLTQTIVYNVTSSGVGSNAGGIWQAGGGLAADPNGSIYFMSGNGTFIDAQTNFGSSFVKMSPGLTVTDTFTPFNFNALNSADLDLGSSGVVLIPGTNHLIGGGKQGKLYLLNRNNLGGYVSGGPDNIVQSFQIVGGVSNNHIHGTPAYWSSSTDNRIYVWTESDSLKAYSYNSGAASPINTAQVISSSIKLPDGFMPGGMLSISANGNDTNTGILWAAHPTSQNANNAVVTGTLAAYNASATSQSLDDIWNSRQNIPRDDLGWFGKFSSPTIANGKVYATTLTPDANTSGQLVVYGLLIPKTLATIAGAGQSIAVTNNFGNPLTAKVSDWSNSPISGTQVVFQAPASGEGGTFGGVTNLYTGTTDINGLVTTSVFTANTIAGSYNVTATATYGNVSGNFGLTNTCLANALAVIRNTDNGNDACGTLSYALNQAATAVSPVTINISAPLTITVTGPLPIITPTAGVTVTIAGGCTVVSGRGQPGVTLKAGAGAGTNALTLTSSMIITGVAITNFSSGYALNITGSNNQVMCSWLGTVDGTTASGNGGGIQIAGSNNQLGLAGQSASGNLISGNSGPGIRVISGSNNLAFSNWIGLKKDSSAGLRNAGGIIILAGGQLKMLLGNQVSNT